jgi:hypothetical protein
MMENMSDNSRWLTGYRLKWILWWLIAIAILAATRFVLTEPGPYVVYPNSTVAMNYDIEVCAFREATGIPCPFCGLTRSSVLVSHGRIMDGFLYHPLGPALIAGAFFLTFYSPYIILKYPELKSSGKSGLHLMIISILLLIAVWIVGIGRHYGWIAW